MNKTFWNRFLDSCSDNRKSKTCPELGRRIQNPKWVGIFAVVLTFAFGGVVAQAQQAKKVARIGLLSYNSASLQAPRVKAFREGLRDIGYIEGQNITIE